MNIFLIQFNEQSLLLLICKVDLIMAVVAMLVVDQEAVDVVAAVVVVEVLGVEVLLVGVEEAAVVDEDAIKTLL
jgi:hypothetical protein